MIPSFFKSIFLLYILNIAGDDPFILLIESFAIHTKYSEPVTNGLRVEGGLSMEGLSWKSVNYTGGLSCLGVWVGRVWLWSVWRCVNWEEEGLNYWEGSELGWSELEGVELEGFELEISGLGGGGGRGCSGVWIDVWPSKRSSYIIIWLRGK